MGLDTNLDETMQLGVESCLNPWNGLCVNSNIMLYIVYEGNRLPICKKCWIEISSEDIEWRYN